MKKNGKSQGPLFFFCTFQYLNVYMPASGFSECTIGSYRIALQLFRKYLFEILHIPCGDFRFSQCTRDCLYGFMKWLETERGNCASSRNLRLVEIQSYVRYASDCDISLVSICNEVFSVKPCHEEKPIRELLTVQHMVGIANVIPNTPKGLRNKTIVLFQYETACRISEVLTASLKDIYLDAEYPYVIFKGKGKKERIVPLSKNMCTLLRKYLSIFHDTGMKGKTGLLFYSNRKGVYSAISARTVQIFLKNYALTAREKDRTIPKDVYTHMLRRSKATEIYRGTNDIYLVSSILGHEEIETTKIYAKPSLEMMREAAERTALKDYVDEKPNWLDKESLMAKYFGL
jgi:integrase/recombinase XerD